MSDPRAFFVNRCCRPHDDAGTLRRYLVFHRYRRALGKRQCLYFFMKMLLPCVKDAVMAKKIYVGNLPWSTTSEKLQTLFAAHGTVQSAEVISDRDTGRSRGFGFVEME